MNSQTSSADHDYTKTMNSLSLTSTDHDYINATTAVGETSGNCEKYQKLMAQLDEKEKQLNVQQKFKERQLEECKQEIKELEAKLALKQARKIQAKTVTDELKTLDMAESEKIDETFPLPNVYFYIKGLVVVLGKQRSYTLYADKDGDLLTSLDGQRFSLAGPFRFTKQPDGTFSIYSISQEKYLKCRNANGTYSLNCCANYCSKIDTKFELLKHEDKQHADGISVDIRSLANDCFLSMENYKIVANSHAAPPNKFWIIPMDGQ